MIAEHHRNLLEESAVLLDVAEAAGVQTEGAALVFPWRSIDGREVRQRRPDVPKVDEDGREMKYVFPSGAAAPLWNVTPDRLPGAELVLIVEGTKQCLAAASWAPQHVAVIGVAGCSGWSHDGVADPELGQLPTGVELVVGFDKDLATNRNVWDAGERLAGHLAALGHEVRFLNLPAAKKAGLDDWLAAVPADRRTEALTRLIGSAGKLPRKPARAKPKPTTEAGSPFLDCGRLLVDTFYKAVVDREHLALDTSGRLCVYRDGAYRADPNLVRSVVVELLGDDYKREHYALFAEVAAARLTEERRVCGPDRNPLGLLNVENGLLDPGTGKLRPHTPEHLSTVQLPYEWDPAATCPTFDRWLLDVLDAELAEVLLEDLAQLLERRPGRQRKAVFLHGPTRSGKSTLLRILERLVGHDNRAAVTLHELATDRFATADLAGAILNSAADLSAAHVEDLSLFKMLLGDDPVRAQRKFGHPFVFRCEALFVFSANSVPTVSEVSRAYLARMRPYRFGRSFEGHEDTTLEDRLAAELPGVLVRLVDAYQRHRARGGYAESDGTRRALDEFARHSDRVRLFLAETTDARTDGFVVRGDLWDTFERWREVNRRQTLGRHRFYESVELAGYRQAKRAGVRGFVGLDLRSESEWGTDDPDEGQKGQASPSPCYVGIGNEEEEVRERKQGEGGIGPVAPSAPNGNGHHSAPEPAPEDLDAEHYLEPDDLDLDPDEWDEVVF